MNESERQKLQREREKLDRLVDEALKNGTPLSETYEIMEQSKKVQKLMLSFYNKNKGSNISQV